MVDLFAAMAAMAILGAVAFEITRRSLRDRGGLVACTLSFAVLGATACVYFFNGWLTWAKLVPLDAAIVWTNLAPLLLCVSAGAAMCLAGRPLWRRVGIAGIVVVFAIGTLVQPVMQPALKPVTSTPNTVWLPGGVCQQTSAVTCSPAAAVTLLNASGVRRDERELIQWCLTDSLGTTSLGLWRGLRLATRETAYQPQVMDVELKDLLSREQRSDVFPCLILVGFSSIRQRGGISRSGKVVHRAIRMAERFSPQRRSLRSAS